MVAATVEQSSCGPLHGKEPSDGKQNEPIIRHAAEMVRVEPAMKKPAMKTTALCAVALGVSFTSVHAGLITTDNFGSGGNAFSIQFAAVGNAGNANDAGAGGGSYSSPYGGVSYGYRMGVVEVSQDWITKATNLGMSNVTAGAWSANRPAANMTWYEAAAFVNWLNTSKGHQAAYQLNGTNTALTLWTSGQAWQAGGENRYRHKDAYYFLPNENEWYKAAYHKNDGVTANYWDYATGSNSIPDGIDFSGDTAFDAVFGDPFNQGSPNEVTNVGLASAYGTMGQNGNVREWNESAFDGINDSSSESRASRGGGWGSSEDVLRSSFRFDTTPSFSGSNVGFRVASVASVPEPSAALFGFGLSLMCVLRRRRHSSL
jgi:formylglycine-generating enzyme required for sulfatase activity